MEKSVQELAEFLHGTVEHNNPELKVTGVNGLVEAGPTDISFAVPPSLILFGKVHLTNWKMEQN